MKKMCIVTMIAFLTISVAFAGGGQSTQSQERVGGPARLSVAIADNIRIQDMKTNHMTRLIERGANVDLDFVVLPSSGYIERINLMVMAGGRDLPDVLMGNNTFSDAAVFRWGLAGSIIPLTRYYRDMNASANLHEAMRRDNVNILPHITSPDGEIYSLPHYLVSLGNEHQPKAWYYKPWLDQLRLQVPTTTEEFRNVLRAVVTGDPNGNGRPDEIGMTGTFRDMADIWGVNWFQFLMNAFIYAGDPNFFLVNNGRVSAAYTDPEWREGLRYIRSLFAEGLMPIENLTQDVAQVRVLANSDPQRVFIIPYADLAHVDSTNPAIDEYDYLLPLRGPRGVQYTGNRPTVANAGMVITSNCIDPDAAFRMGDFMMRIEIGTTSRFGQEGVHWDYPHNIPNVNINDFIPRVEGWPISIIAYDDAGFWGGTGVTNAAWRQMGPIFTSYSLGEGLGFTVDTPRNQILTGRARGSYSAPTFRRNEIIPKLIFNEQELNEVDELMATLRSYLLESTANFLAGNRDIDATWNAYINDINAIGLARVLSTVQGIYDRMYR